MLVISKVLYKSYAFTSNNDSKLWRLWNAYRIVLYYRGIRCRYAIKTKLCFTHNVVSYVKISKYIVSAGWKKQHLLLECTISYGLLETENCFVIITNLNGLFKTKYLEIRQVVILCKGEKLLKYDIFNSDSCSGFWYWSLFAYIAV